MIWDDEGYLISKTKYNENSIIADFFTKNHGKTSGMIFGATSKKIKIREDGIFYHLGVALQIIIIISRHNIFGSKKYYG